MAQQMAIKQNQEQMVSSAMSVAVVKNCVRLAVSTVAFARRLFPPNAFTSKNYGGVNLEVLRPVDGDGEVIDEGAQRVHDWLERGAFKALELNYLEKITFNILDSHPTDPNAKILESYSFKVSNSDPRAKGLSVTSSKTQTINGSAIINTTTSSSKPRVTKDEVHQAMQQLVKKMLMITSALEALPSMRWLSMSITYNELAPKDYEAPEFCAQDPEQIVRFVGEDPLCIPVGDVFTGFQTVSLKFRQALREEDDVNMQSTQRVHDDAPKETESGYDSDDTNLRWQKQREDIMTMAARIVKVAEAQGKDPEAEIRNSKLADRLPESALLDLLKDLKVSKTTKAKTTIAKANKESAKKTQIVKEIPEEAVSESPMLAQHKRVSSVKRPFQQISDSTASQDMLSHGNATHGQKTYSKRNRA